MDDFNDAFKRFKQFYNVEPGFEDGGRVGFDNGGGVRPVPKGYINLVELGEKVGLPERIVTNPETGRKRALSGLRQRIIENLTRKPSAERRNLKSRDFIDNVLVKKLDLKKIDLGQGRPTYIIKDPKKTELKTLKEYFLRKGSKYGVTKETVDNMKLFYNDNDFKKYIRKGELIPRELILKKGLTENQAANITLRLAQALKGKKFKNIETGIPVNKNLSKKLISKIEKAPFGNPYSNAMYKEAMDVIETEVGSEYFDKPFGDMKREARRLLNKEGIPVADPRVKGSKGVNINELIGMKTGARTGTAVYTPFVNLMEGKLNTSNYARFVSEFEKYNNKLQTTDNKNKVIKEYDNYRKNFIKTTKGIKDSDVPKFSLKNPKAVYGQKRIKELLNLGLDLDQSYNQLGYTIDLGKKTRTIKEFLTKPKIDSKLKKFGKIGAIGAGALAIPSVLQAADGTETANGFPTKTTAGAGLAAGAVGTKTGRKLLSKGFKGLGVALGPTGLIGLNYALGVDPKDTVDRIGLEAETALAPSLVKGATSVTDKIKTPMLRKIAERASLAGLSPAMALRIARVASPIGLASLAGEGLYQAGKYAIDRRKELQSMSPEQLQELKNKSDDFAFNEFSAAGGGLAKLAGKRSGAPPESGPTPQGLDYLLKRGRQY